MKKLKEAGGRLVECLESRKDDTDPVDQLIQELSANERLRGHFIRAVARDEGLLRDISAVVEGGVDKATEQPGFPPIGHGRRIEQDEPISGGWLRLEYVPCGNPRCRKDPDEHGPYWYSHRFLDGRWRMKYHGTSRPALEPPVAVEDARRVLDVLGGRAELTDQELTHLRRIVADLNATAGSPEMLLRVKALDLIVREKKRRGSQLRQLHTEFLEKSLAGLPLTTEERVTFDNAADLLMEDH